MLKIAKKYISTNSKLVISDEWKSYKCLRRAGYSIDSVNHSKTFVKAKPHYIMAGNSKVAVQVHTNNVENLWSRMKRISKLFYGIHSKHFQGVMDECLMLISFKCYNHKSIKGWIQILQSFIPKIHNKIKWHQDERYKRLIFNKYKTEMEIDELPQFLKYKNDDKTENTNANPNPKKRKMECSTNLMEPIKKKKINEVIDSTTILKGKHKKPQKTIIVTHQNYSTILGYLGE